MLASMEVDGQIIQLIEGPVQDLRNQKQVRLPESPSESSPIWLTARSTSLSPGVLAPGQSRRHRALAWLRSTVKKLRAWLRAFLESGGGSRGCLSPSLCSKESMSTR
jgi:hypothetical protein